MPDTPPDALAQASYRIVGTPIEPRAQWRREGDGSWLLEGPPLEYGLDEAGPLAWRALRARAEDHSPMMGQRGPDGAWRLLTWSQAWQLSRALASALLAAGHGPNDPIATLSGNSIEQWLLRLAAMQAGIPLVHLSPAYSLLSRDHAQLRAALALVPCGTLFVQDGRSFAPALAALAADGQHRSVIAVTNVAAGQSALADLLAAPIDPRALDHARASITPDTWCGVYFTSGSTGQPKAVPNTHRMIDAQQRLALARVSPEERRPQVWLDWLPWHHVFAGVANLGRLLSVGGTYYIDDGRPLPGQFDATLRNLHDVAPTSYVSSPVAFARLAAALEADETLAAQFFSRLEGMGYGGASLPAETWQRMQHLAIRHTGHKLPFLCGMGSTETAAAGVALYWACDDIANIGLPISEVQLRLMPLDGQPDLGGRFELRIRGPQVFEGYIGREDLNALAFDEHGFYKLGDAVRFIDPADPLRGLRFDGRVVEDFKLGSGTWVRAGAVRLQAVSLLSPLVSDAVVCGQDRAAVGVLAWPVEAALRALDPALAAAPVAELLAHPRVLRELAERLDAAPSLGGSTTIERVALLTTPPSLDAGEITDKGYVNQSAALRHRAADVERLYASGAAEGVAQRARTAA